MARKIKPVTLPQKIKMYVDKQLDSGVDIFVLKTVARDNDVTVGQVKDAFIYFKRARFYTTEHEIRKNVVYSYRVTRSEPDEAHVTDPPVTAWLKIARHKTQQWNIPAFMPMSSTERERWKQRHG